MRRAAQEQVVTPNRPTTMTFTSFARRRSFRAAFARPSWLMGIRLAIQEVKSVNRRVLLDGARPMLRVRNVPVGNSGSPSWIRTNDQVINSHLLYR